MCLGFSGLLSQNFDSLVNVPKLLIRIKHGLLRHSHKGMLAKAEKGSNEHQRANRCELGHYNISFLTVGASTLLASFRIGHQ
jgi:hypothetical protein